MSLPMVMPEPHSMAERLTLPIRQCLMDARDAAEVLGLDSDFRTEADSVLQRLYPYQIGHKGNLSEWYFDWEDRDPTHRHQSHLYGLFPGRHISPASTRTSRAHPRVH